MNVMPNSLLLRLLIAAVATLLLSSCSSTPQTRALLAQADPGIPPQVELTAVPFHPQEQYQCGPAALATVLNYSEAAVSPDELTAQVYVPERQGSLQVEMIAATRHYQRLAYTLPTTLEALLTSVAAGQPVLILQNLGLSWYPQWHYAVVVGYDLERRQILLRSGTTEHYSMTMGLFERTWRRAEHWGMVALTPGELPASGTPQHYFLTAAAFETQAPAAMVVRAWQAGLKRWPENTELLMGYGNFLYDQKDFDAAAQQFRAVTDLNPQYGAGYNNLAQSLLAADRLAEARVAAQRAVASGGELEDVFRDTLQQIDKAAQSAPNKEH